MLKGTSPEKRKLPLEWSKRVQTTLPSKISSLKFLNFPLFWKRGLRSAKGLKTNARRSQILTCLWRSLAGFWVRRCVNVLLRACYRFFCSKGNKSITKWDVLVREHVIRHFALYLVSKRTKFSYYLSIICVRRLLGWWFFYVVVVVPLVLLAVVYIGLYICSLLRSRF